MLDRVKGEQDYQAPSEETVMPDGTVRVRKKKRRSNQPIHKKRQRRKFLILGAVLLSTLVLAFLVVSFLRNRAHYAGERFSDAVVEGIRANTSAEVEVEGLRISGEKMSLDSVVVTSKEQGALMQTLELSRLEAIISLKDRHSLQWDLKPAKVDRARVALGGPAESDRFPAAFFGRRMELGGGSGLEALSFHRIEIERLDLVWGEQGEGIFDCVAYLSHRGGTEWGIHVRNGELRLEGWPTFTLTYLNMVAGPEGIDVEGSQFGPSASPRAIAAKGFLAYRPGPKTKIEVTVSDLPSEELVANPWASSLHGTLDGKLRYSVATIDSGSEPNIAGVWTLKNGSPENLLFWQMLPPALRNLHAVNAGLARTGTAEFVWTPRQVLVGNISLGQENLIGFRGDLVWERAGDGPCRGDFQFGLAGPLLEALPGGRPPFFETIGRDGVNWSSLGVAGTLAKPEEDFSPRLIQHLSTGKASTPPADAGVSLPQ